MHKMKKLKDQVNWSEVVRQSGADTPTILTVRLGLIDGLDVDEIAQQHGINQEVVEEIARFFVEENT